MMYHQRNAILKWGGIIFVVLLVGWFIWQNHTSSDEVWLNLQNVRNNDKALVQAQESNSHRPEESQKQSVKLEAARTEQGDSQLESEKTVQKIVVHCAGAVVKPGVYFLSADARVVDVVKAAGGVTGSADLNQINLAESLTDGVKVYIPYRGLAGISEVDGSAIIGSSVSSGGSHTTSTRGTKGGLINLNTASVDELMTLPGIGASKAAAIIRYREEKGRFKKPEDLLLISGIGEKTFAKLKESVTT